ncbi:hypothetical protein BDV38DRAFT_243003 [Aspergillus pseudotamarii]|uniref:Uncharacterized protein n=1 Tax=Aspergillus pseudotamarii TaxID=132259 RepID=A0A5N6SZL3_ASPPS|nr:uncharacterized protein BDV38DRAFT_243003 [Aspergillus pseudotamarii]KAE8139209.1 hypothetical protein BDV38DRAFT_243003 [Aspergillus pseudotamarii]
MDQVQSWRYISSALYGLGMTSKKGRRYEEITIQPTQRQILYVHRRNVVSVCFATACAAGVVPPPTFLLAPPYA